VRAAAFMRRRCRSSAHKAHPVIVATLGGRCALGEGGLLVPWLNGARRSVARLRGLGGQPCHVRDLQRRMVLGGGGTKALNSSMRKMIVKARFCALS
jgi:hypothetical protein